MPDREETVIKAEKIRYTYADGTEALKGIDLEIRRGERVAVMGANGSGKSTFFLHLNGILKPGAGIIYLNGKPLDYSRKGLLDARRRVGFVFQDSDNQLFSSSVVQEISFGILNVGATQEEARVKVDQVMEELNITPFSHKPTHFLSGGQKKRVAIADILVMEPEVIILDEPASALDPRHARLIDGIVDGLSEKGITVILSTHDVERALIWADRILLFHEGRVIGEGTPETIFQDEDLMNKTNLEKPTVMRLFESLCSAGVLNSSLPVPRTAAQLEGYIDNATKETKGTA